MNKYDKWLSISLEKLVSDFTGEIFKPQNESDIKCHLYHNLIQFKKYD